MVHIVDPDLSSIHSPAATNNDAEAYEGAINYVKEVCGFYRGEEYVNETGIMNQHGVLIKPVIMIINTSSVVVNDATNGAQKGGRHWQACVMRRC